MISITCKDIETLFSLTRNALYEGWTVVTVNSKDGMPSITLDKSGDKLPDKRWIDYARSVGAYIGLPYRILHSHVREDWESDQWKLQPLEKDSGVDPKWQSDFDQAWGKDTPDGWIDPISGIKF